MSDTADQNYVITPDDKIYTVKEGEAQSGVCLCGEAKRFRLFYHENVLHRQCRTCLLIMNMET